MIGTARSTHLRSWLQLALVFFVAPSAVSHELVIVRRPAVAGDSAGFESTIQCPDHSQIIRLSSDGSERHLTGGFLAACDPAVSFDGNQILFAGRKSSGDRFQIWRMDVDGGAMVQITSDAGDAFSPLWVGSLFHLNDDAPTQRIAYLATGHGWFDRRIDRPAAALYTSDLDGANPWRISYHLSSILAPDVLANGRLVFAAWRGGPRETVNSRRSLMAVNNDGTDLMAFYDNHSGPAHPHSVAVGMDGRVYFVEADGASPLGGGDLAYVTLRRPLHSRSLLADSGNGAYLDPLPLADGGLLVSYRSSGADASYDLYRIDPSTGRRLEPVLVLPGFDILDAQELMPHARVKGRSSVVDLSKDSGVFFCISSHLTDRPGLEHLKQGGAAALRVVEGVPVTAGEIPSGSNDGERLLGEVAIEDDGSFHIEVPAGVPLRFELLDAHGEPVARQESWTWVMPREWRGCIGCHEDREMVAPNTLADAFVKPAARFDRPGEVRGQ